VSDETVTSEQTEADTSAADSQESLTDVEVDVEVRSNDNGDFEEAVAEISIPAVPAKVGTATTTGRRKQAVARVRITPGSGTWKINGRTLPQYFPDKVHQQLVASPFVTTGSVEHYDVTARIDGGGTSGQAGALRMGISRALNEIDEEAHRASLKKAGFLTRDPRAKERKKYGLKKARKAPQYSKR